MKRFSEGKRVKNSKGEKEKNHGEVEITFKRT